MNTTHFAIFEKECKSFINPLHPKISLYILHTALYTFPKVLTERISLAKWLLEFLGIPRNKGVNFHGKFGLGIPRNS